MTRRKPGAKPPPLSSQLTRSPPEAGAPQPFEPRRVWPIPENIWSQAQFWRLAHQVANAELTAMLAARHPLAIAARTGALDPAIAADSVMNIALNQINMQVLPAGNA